MSKILPGISIILSIIFSCTAPKVGMAQYKISGQLHNYDSLWLNGISLSAINSTTHLYFASADIIINKDTLDKEGHFTIKGNNLPDENLIYRMDLSNKKNTIMIQTGKYLNYIFLILNNHSSVIINCNNFSGSPLNYTVEGSPENTALQEFEKYLDGLQELFRAPGSEKGTGKEYAVNRFNTNIRNYCDTCKWPIVALMAVSEIDDFEKDYSANKKFYKRFLSRINALDSSSIYAKEFEKKLDILDYQNQAGNSKSGYLANPLVYIEGIIILFLIGFIQYLKNKMNRVKTIAVAGHEPNRSELFETLTRREKEILALLIEDIQNKEIANKLNLEVSTIKTHISNIYQKLAISGRNEVKAFRQYTGNANGTSI